VLRDVLLQRAETDSNRLAFAHDDEQVTFAQLAERSRSRAAALSAQHGVGQGDRVAVVMSAGIPLVETVWACQLLGAAPAVLNPSLPDPILSRRKRLIRPSLTVTDDLVPAQRPASDCPAELPIRPDDLAFLQLTSGTSGAPRASMILQRNVIAYLDSSRTGTTLSPDDVLVSWVPPWHDLGLVRFVIGPVYVGASCHIVAPAIRTIPEWIQTISRVHGTYSAAPDFAARLAVRMVDPTSVDLGSLRCLKLGAEPIRLSTIELFESTFGTPGAVVPGYGLGEATLGVCEHLPGEHVPIDEQGNVSCGLPNRGLEVHAGRPGAPSEILVRGPSVFAGYFDAPEETRRKLSDGWLHTGDLGYIDASGRLFVLGRREGMIKRAGTVIAPLELEEAAERVEGVRIAAVTTVSGADGEIVVVAIETGSSAGRSDEQIAADVSRELVASVGFAPGRVSVLPRRTIPRTENGKIRHGHLREMLEAGSSAPALPGGRSFA
jgi:fatty-acyl-CoA synthase